MSSIEENVRPAFMRRVFQVFLALALLSAFMSLAGKWVGRTIALAGHTESTAIHEIVIGNNVLAVPANMIRFDTSRQTGVASRLDLYMRWPELDGYSAAARDDFNHADGSRNIVFVSFQKRMMSRDMSGRYHPIYASLIRQDGKPGPAGLSLHDLARNSGYLDETIAVGWQESREEPFVARCLAGESAVDSLAPCERDLHVGEGLSLLYRFPAHLLAEWRQLDAAMLTVFNSLVQTNG